MEIRETESWEAGVQPIKWASLRYHQAPQSPTVISIVTYRLQYCLEWVMQVYTSKLTLDSVVTYLFHDCRRSLWLFCLMGHKNIRLRWSNYSTHRVTPTRLPRSSAHVRNVWEIKTVLLRISIWSSCHFAGFHVANRVVTLLLLCADVRRVLAHFIANTVAHANRRRVYRSFLWRDGGPISCARSAVAVAATARPICHTLCFGA